MVNLIVLHGFRATGKSTVGPRVADRLGWDHVEMDEEIVKRSGRTITEITNNGTNWEAFRKLEHEIFISLLDRTEMVLITGGGTIANDYESNEGIKYGEKSRKSLNSKEGLVNILLSADDEAIKKRIKETEMNKRVVQRPMLNEEKAKKIIRKMQVYSGDPIKMKEIQVDAIVEDAMKVYASRKKIYKEIADITFDTGDLSVEETVEEVIKYMKNKS
jgi:shikimate kinase